MDVPEPEAIARVLAQRGWQEHPALPGRRNHLRAGVMTPLVWRGGALDTVMLLRQRRLRTHGNEVGFPGGKPEPDDTDLEHTARRELAEELGVTEVEVLGRLSSMPIYTSEHRLEPFVGRWDADAQIVPDEGEVAQVLALDLMPLVHGGPLEIVTTPGAGRTWEMPIVRVDGWVVYGATALTLVELVGVVAEAAGASGPTRVASDLAWQDIIDHRASAGRVAG